MVLGEVRREWKATELANRIITAHQRSCPGWGGSVPEAKRGWVCWGGGKYPRVARGWVPSHWTWDLGRDLLLFLTPSKHYCLQAGRTFDWNAFSHEYNFNILARMKRTNQHSPLSSPSTIIRIDITYFCVLVSYVPALMSLTSTCINCACVPSNRNQQYSGFPLCSWPIFVSLRVNGLISVEFVPMECFIVWLQFSKNIKKK